MVLERLEEDIRKGGIRHRQEKLTNVFNSLISQGRTLEQVQHIMLLDDSTNEQWVLQHNAIILKLSWEYRIGSKLGI